MLKLTLGTSLKTVIGTGGRIAIPPGYVIEAPINLVGVGSDEGAGVFAATLTWEDNPINDNISEIFDIYKDGSFLITVDSVLTYQDTDVLPDTGYTYSVKSVDILDQISPKTLPVAVGIPNLIVADKPLNIRKKAVYSTEAWVTWDAAVQGTYPVVEYEVYVNSTYKETVTGLGVTIPGVEFQTYTVGIIPVDDHGFRGTVGTITYKLIHTHAKLGVEFVQNDNFKVNLGGWDNGGWWVWQANGDGQAHHPYSNVNRGLLQRFTVDKGVKNYHLSIRIRVMQGRVAIAMGFYDQGETYKQYGVGWHDIAFDKRCSPKYINFKRASNFLGNVEFCSIKEILESLEDRGTLLQDGGVDLTD